MRCGRLEWCQQRRVVFRSARGKQKTVYITVIRACIVYITFNVLTDIAEKRHRTFCGAAGEIHLCIISSQSHTHPKATLSHCLDATSTMRAVNVECHRSRFMEYVCWNTENKKIHTFKHLPNAHAVDIPIFGLHPIRLHNSPHHLLGWRFPHLQYLLKAF